ncbi:MAG: SH3 domain-containing protein [Chlamydiales bacterium]|nr:SH3 domain-containing protein [Chlamydiales bacterium]
MLWRYFTVLCVCCFTFAAAEVVGPSDALGDHLKRAYESYMAGETATTVGEREQHFNRALRLYTQLEAEPGNGRLFYDIGNTYFQLEQYGWSILYYLRAQRLLPRDDRVQFHLTLAQAQQHLPIDPDDKWKNRLFYWHMKLSQSERIQLFVGLAAITALLASFLIWRRSETVKIVTGITTVCSLLVLGSVLYYQYFAPVEGVVVKAFGLYHGPSEDYALVSDEPFTPGTQLTVENVVENGQWLKVETSSGRQGYIPSDVFRLI